MTQPPQPTEPFAQHPRLAELVTALGFRRYPLFLTGLLYQEPGGPLRRATAVASRDRNQAFFAHEVAGWTKGRRSINEIGIELLHHWFLRPEVSAAGHHRLRGPRGGAARGHRRRLDELRRLADRHERGFVVEQVMELLATS
jgi:hypothetical protein